MDPLERIAVVLEARQQVFHADLGYRIVIVTVGCELPFYRL
jgi:hypothetical protein